MLARILTATAIAAAVAATYWPALGFAFLNWDDPRVIVSNPSLDFPGAWRWAFTTFHLEHYQPISWLAWAAVKAGAGLDAAWFHAANVAVHALVSILVWAVGRPLLARAVPDAPVPWRDGAALAAALLYGLHPLRVEVAAWISALPYALGVSLALASTWAWLAASAPGAGRSLVPAVLLFAASLAARAVALGLPAVFVILDTSLHRRALRASVVRALPFAGLAVASAGVEYLARAPGLAEVPWLYRLQSAASAPFVYLWRTVLPVRLTPLDVLPLDPVGSAGGTAGAVIALVGVSAAAWHWRCRWPSLAAAWACYLALLVPAAGLVASGQQASADRYTYLPGIVVALAAAGVGLRASAGQVFRASALGAAALILLLASVAVTRATLAPWADSVSLWTRVVTLDPENDVGLYNLGVALAAEGRPDEAAARYREALAVNPAHADARANLALLDAARLEREGNDLAARGELAEAASRYEQAIALDPARRHSRSSLGMALATLGRTGEALPHLREAFRQGETDAAVANALGVLLQQAGEPLEARAVFEQALAVHQTDVGLAHNLARLLATTPGLAPQDAALALRIARAVVDATGGRDARAMDTLASALAVNGLVGEARATSARAAALAEAQGDRDLAVQITARGRAFRDPGP
ncbi:MAG: tetratricopeptide repeat protein [Vicinamibacterales bacterium]